MTSEENGPAVGFAVAGGVATLTLDRPASRNALSTEIQTGLLDGIARAEQTDGIRAVVLTHTGPVFCAGADLRAQDASGGSAGVGELPRILEAIARSPLAFVARLLGPALGGGVGLAAACDISVAAEEVRLGFTEVRLGVIPAVISVVCLPKLRRGDALELFLTGERIAAGRAATAGLITASVPADQVDDTIAHYLDQLVRGGPQALAAAKALVYGDRDTTASYARMAGVSARLFASDEAIEGRAAFKAKRPAAWVPAPAVAKEAQA